MIIEFQLIPGGEAAVVKGMQALRDIGRYQVETELFQHYPIVIDILDGDLLRVWTKSDKLSKRLIHAFKNTRYIELDC